MKIKGSVIPQNYFEKLLIRLLIRVKYLIKELIKAYPKATVLISHWGFVDAPDFAPFIATQNA